MRHRTLQMVEGKRKHNKMWDYKPMPFFGVQEPTDSRRYVRLQ